MNSLRQVDKREQRRARIDDLTVGRQPEHLRNIALRFRLNRITFALQSRFDLATRQKFQVIHFFFSIKFSLAFLMLGCFSRKTFHIAFSQSFSNTSKQLLLQISRATTSNFQSPYIFRCNLLNFIIIFHKNLDPIGRKPQQLCILNLIKQNAAFKFPR